MGGFLSLPRYQLLNTSPVEKLLHFYQLIVFVSRRFFILQLVIFGNLTVVPIGSKEMKTNISHHPLPHTEILCQADSIFAKFLENGSRRSQFECPQINHKLTTWISGTQSLEFQLLNVFPIAGKTNLKRRYGVFHNFTCLYNAHS